MAKFPVILCTCCLRNYKLYYHIKTLQIFMSRMLIDKLHNFQEEYLNPAFKELVQQAKQSTASPQSLYDKMLRSAEGKLGRGIKFITIIQ